MTSQFEFYLTTVVTLVTGTMFLMAGQQITERGIGNGISRSSARRHCRRVCKIVGHWQDADADLASSLPILLVIALFIGVIAVTYLVVFVERGQRKVLVNYAKRPGWVKRVMQGHAPAAEAEHGGL